MIDTKNGDIYINNSQIKLTLNLSVEQFKKTPLYSGENIKPFYSVKHSVHIANKNFKIALYFLNNKLKEIRLYSEEIALGTSWLDFSEQKELERKKEHDKWLENLIGKGPYLYSWGEIISVFDKKGGVSSIIIRYK
jgi:hypothetical protein